MDPLGRKYAPAQHIVQERPSYQVIGLLKVSFEHYTWSLPYFCLTNHFVGYHYAIRHVSSPQKSQLRDIYDFV